MRIVISILKIIGAIFFGLASLGGIISLFSPSTISSKILSIIFICIFLVLTIFLMYSACKKKDKAIVGKSHKPLQVKKPALTPVNIQGNFNQKTIVRAIERPSLLPAYQQIPQTIFNLLWFSNGPFQNYRDNRSTWSFSCGGRTVHVRSIMAQEPSAIDVELPIASQVLNHTPLNYYPSYRDLTPEQRRDYLNWLVDITAPIDIGYVFIFYYGLERHLFFGEAEAALATIFVLRKFHNNTSFLTYSGDAIVLYALLHDRPDLMQHIDLHQISIDLRLFASSISTHSLSAQDIMSGHKKFSFENNRYIKGEPTLFLSTLEGYLFDQYAAREFSISLDDFRSVKGSFTLALANYSLLPEQRFLALPDISTAPRVHSAIHALLTTTHEAVKVKLREFRKSQK